MSEEEIAEAQEVLDRYFAEGTEAERRFFADEYTLMEELAEDDWSDAEWRRYQLMCALYEKVDSKSSFSSGLAEEIQFMGKFRNWSLDISAWYYGYEVNDFQKSNNVFANSHTQHPYITFGGNLTGGLLTYYMAASAAGQIPGLAQRIGGWSERLSTFPILRRIGQDHLSNIIGATIVDTGAFTVPKAIIDIYNGESSETVFRNAGVDIGRNVLFNIFGEAVSGAIGRVVQRFKGGRETITSTLGNEIDITPSSNHTLVSKNPGPFGEANTSVDILDADGNIKTRRWYDSNGRAYRDVDMSDHGNPKEHLEVPHEHTWEYNDGKPKRN